MMESRLAFKMKSLNSRISWTVFRNAKIISVEPIIFLYMFATFLYFTLSQQHFFNQYALEVSFSNSEVASSRLNNSACVSASDLESYSELNNTYQIVQEKSTQLAIYTSLASRVLSAVSTVLLGPFSDRFGRRPVFIIISLGSILQGICGLLVIYLNLSLYYFVLGAVLVGLCGDVATMFSATLSYVSDISSSKWRTVRLGVAESMVFVAVMISSGGSGVWFHKLGCHLGPPLILYVACHVIIILYTFLFLPESLRKDDRINKHGGLRVFLRGFQILVCGVDKYKSSVWKLWSAFIPVLITGIIIICATTVAIFFFKALNWDSVKIGAYFATSMGSHLLATTIILPIMVAMKLPDFLISLIGVIFNCFLYLFLGFTQETYQIFISELFTLLFFLCFVNVFGFAVAVLQGMSALVVPPMRGLMSKVVSADDKGMSSG